MKLLITGATGKLGRNFTEALFQHDVHSRAVVRAFCHNRTLDDPRIESVTGSLSSSDDVQRAMKDVTHVLHMAAVKESPDLAMDVGVKGMFNLMEAFRTSPTAQQFILIGGDCSVGHIFHEYDAPITENSPRRAYPGCYALTKVIEEVMLEQYVIQYGLDACCLRAPWIMEKDDFRYALSFDEQFGGPAWNELLSEAQIADCIEKGAVPLLRDHRGEPLKRNFVHVSDLVNAILAALGHPDTKGEFYNICMNAPVDYGVVSEYMHAQFGAPIIDIPTPYYSNWLDNAKARQALNWSPKIDTRAMIDAAWAYERAPDDPRIVWYPG